MKPHLKYTPDGTLIQHKGSLSNTNILLVLGRKNTQKSVCFFSTIVTALSNIDTTVIWFPTSKTQATFNFIDPMGKYAKFPRIVRWFIILYFLLQEIKQWPSMYLAAHYQHPHTSISEHAHSIKIFIDSLNSKAEISIIAQSSGGIIASQVANQIKIKKIICLGYPFRHPNTPPEKYRTQHLAHVKTPFLILQGNNDPYGNRALALKSYRLSSSICIAPIDTDHDFLLSPEITKKTIKKIIEFHQT